MEAIIDLVVSGMGWCVIAGDFCKEVVVSMMDSKQSHGCLD